MGGGRKDGIDDGKSLLPGSEVVRAGQARSSSNGVHPALYIAMWILLSSSVILYNKYILHSLDFPYPIFLTTWHLIFATVATRVLAKTTSLLDGLQRVKITTDVYARAILPIGVFFSLSLVFSNEAYLFLSVAFIQMLKATTPVAVLLVGYALQTETPNMVVLGKVMLIVGGVIAASYGEIYFVTIGVVYQVLGVVCEATRLSLVQRLLKGYNMDPLVSLYYFAPIGKTSSLVLCLSGVLKDILLVMVSMMIWSTQLTPLQVVGYGVALFGLVWYKQPAIVECGVCLDRPQAAAKQAPANASGGSGGSGTSARTKIVACIVAGTLGLVAFVSAGMRGSSIHYATDAHLGLPTASLNGSDPCAAEAVPHPRKAKSVSDTLVLVTGGAGFIGSNLVDRLLTLGYRVRVFDNLATGSIRNIPLDNDRVTFIMGDILDMDAVTRATEGVDYVYHLAAMSKVAPSLKNTQIARFCTEVNALGTWNVLEAARIKGIKKVIYAASSTYYGNKPIPHTEIDAADFLTPYAASKFEGEIQMQMFNDIFAVPTVSCRFFMVYGPRQPSTGAYAIVTGVFARQAALGKPLTIEGTGLHSRDFIHVRDIVDGLILSQQLGVKGEVINLGTGTGYSVKQVADLVSDKQIHVAERKNDLEATLANTCKMKRLLGYLPQFEFKKEMTAIARATMQGEVFEQDWVTLKRLQSTPWIFPARTTSLPWYGKESDLEKLLGAFALNEEEKGTVALIIMTPDVPLFVLLNHVYSLVAVGKIEAFVVGATGELLDQIPMAMLEILQKGHSVIYTSPDLSYLGNIKSAFGDEKFDIFVGQTESELQSLVVKPTLPAMTLIEAWSSQKKDKISVGLNAAIQKLGYLCQASGACSAAADKAKVKKIDIPPTCATSRGQLCSDGVLYQATCASIVNTTGTPTLHVAGSAAWYLTQCPKGDVSCDIQQIVPIKWILPNPLDEPDCAEYPVAPPSTMSRIRIGETVGHGSPVESHDSVDEMNNADGFVASKSSSISSATLNSWAAEKLKFMWSNPVKLPEADATSILEHTGEASKGRSSSIHTKGLDLSRETLFLITTTYSRNGWQSDRLKYFGRHIASVSTHLTENEMHCKRSGGSACRQLIWVIVEDAAYIDEPLAELLECSGIPHVYFAFGPTRHNGNAQKNAELDFIVSLTRKFSITGTIHSLDDDSYSHSDSFDLCYGVEKVALIPVWGLGPEGVEYAVNTPKGPEFHSGWTERKYPVDLNGMAFSTRLFDRFEKSNRNYWPFDGYGGETQFLDQLISSTKDIVAVCDKCQVIWHNKPMSPEHLTFKCPSKIVPAST
ncbi:hypothetical protein HK405_005381 [Cladochytrium tenue]|nr:hypothetical protein HK405_005381 [Cladochytrium tenue]